MSASSFSLQFKVKNALTLTCCDIHAARCGKTMSTHPCVEKQMRLVAQSLVTQRPRPPPQQKLLSIYLAGALPLPLPPFEFLLACNCNVFVIPPPLALLRFLLLFPATFAYLRSKRGSRNALAFTTQKSVPIHLINAGEGLPPNKCSPLLTTNRENSTEVSFQHGILWRWVIWRARESVHLGANPRA